MGRTFYPRIETFVQGSRTLEGRYYTSGEVFELEKERIFYRQWALAGRGEDAPHPGDYFLAQIGDESLIVVRGRDQILRAFYNICRHRGTRLCHEATGRVSETIQCPYHAWTYSLDGRLVGAPFMQEAEGFEKSDHGLHPVKLAEWEGFIFVNLHESPPAFATLFSPLRGRFSRFRLPELLTHQTIEYNVRANWKLIVQNYSECLHCPTLHPGLAQLSPFQSGENDLTEGLFLGGYMDIIPTADSLTVSGRACALPVGALPAEDLRRVYYYTIFPNLLLSLHPDYVMFHRLLPLAPDHTRVACGWMFHPQAGAAPHFNPQDAIDFWDLTNRQDWAICEQSQQGVRSRAYRPSPYSPRESLPAAWDRQYLALLNIA